MPKTGQAPESRDVKQYKVYTLYENVIKPLGKKDGKEITRTDRVPVAVFDNKVALEAYQAKQQSAVGYEVVEDWVEVQPTASSFSLHFNPVPNAPVSDAEAKDTPNDNGTD